ncbi:MAG: tRNA pseudouridine(55) synthase TruB [Gammaproteobacteria bacterium]|nr:tRNA pseudouridine(55) synthase TruB [Gammaproteobacteria bacterium]NNF61132.1 tRNA pseudouridine(55) synthase TruB [Gammaproteobacteria bacterium]
MAARRGQRDVHGIVLLDKPVGDTSNRALQRVKRLYQAKKGGHTGSLDPLASGLLVICLGEATKVSAYLLDTNKRYTVSASLGRKTDSGDAAGKVTAETTTIAGRSEIEAVLPRFRGKISQVPPMYSALKHQGRRLYELAREGVEIERKARTVTIFHLELTGCDEQGFELEVACSKGTYVRTLVEDIAEAAGSLAHVRALRRTALGPFSAAEMLSMEQLETAAHEGLETLDSKLEPIDRAISAWPAVRLGQDASWYLQQGQPVTVPRAPAEGWVRLYAAESRFIGIGEVIADGRIAPRRLFRLGNSCL